MARRQFIAQLLTIPLFAGLALPARRMASQKLLIKSAWGSDDPTKAAFPFSHGNALAEAGHEVQIYLLGEAVSLLRPGVAASVVPVGWAPVSEVLAKLVARGVPVYACGACARARGLRESDIVQTGGRLGNPAVFVSLIEWADKVITE
jgi:predicted peroxiredoxin